MLSTSLVRKTDKEFVSYIIPKARSLEGQSWGASGMQRKDPQPREEVRDWRSKGRISGHTPDQMALGCVW